MKDAARIRKLQRDVADTSAAVKRIRVEEDSIERDAAAYDVRTVNAVFGTSAGRPDSAYLKQRGTQSLLYYAIDTGVFSAWDGANWKSTTLT